MKRRRKTEPPRREARPAPFHAPFESLRARVVARAAAPRTETNRATPRSGASTNGAPITRPSGAPRANGESSREPAAVDPAGAREDELTSFLRAVGDVRRIDHEGRIDAPPPAVAASARVVAIDEEAEALAALSDLVSGAGGFDISDSSEYVEGAVAGLDARILRRLRHGEFPYHAMLDLHGMTAPAARDAVEAFVVRAFRAGQRCVLIVHGRGRNSRQQIPVLKEGLKRWLAHGKVGRAVLAFTSARPADGGTGAVYVLLRRRRGAKEPIDVLDGAKRE